MIKISKLFAPIIFTGLYGALVYFSWMHISADESYMAGQEKMDNGNFEVALDQANKSIMKNPYEPRYYYGRAKILLASTVGDKDEKNEIKKLAYADMQKAIRLNPKNLVTLRNLVPIYYFLVVEDLEGVGSANNIDSDYALVVRNYFNRVKRYSPNDVGLPTLTAKYEKRLGFTEDYNESVEMVKALRPDLLEWHPNFN